MPCMQQYLYFACPKQTNYRMYAEIKFINVVHDTSDNDFFSFVCMYVDEFLRVQ